MADAARRWSRIRADDPMAWAYRTGATRIEPAGDEWAPSVPDASVAERLNLLPPDDLAVLVPTVRHDLEPSTVARMLDTTVEAINQVLARAQAHFGAPDIAGLKNTLIWHFDAEVRSLPAAPGNVEFVMQRGRGMGWRRNAMIAGVGLVALVGVLVILSATRRTIVRPDLIQLLPNGVVQVDADGAETRVLEESVAVAKINETGAILYQYDGRAGFPAASIWYRPAPGARSTQVYPLTGGIVGWVDPDTDPNSDVWRAVIITSTTDNAGGVSSTSFELALLEPQTRAVEVIASVGSFDETGGEVVGGFRPLAVAYGGGRILVWTVDAALADSLPNVEAADCGHLELFDLSGTFIVSDLPEFSCDADGITMSAPALSPDGTSLAWIEAEGLVDPEVPPREGWLSSVALRLGTFDLATGRTGSIDLRSFSRPTWWTQYTLFSESTPTLSVDIAGSTSIVSVGIYDPAIDASTYSVFLIDTIGGRIETSIGEGLVTFGR